MFIKIFGQGAQWRNKKRKAPPMVGPISEIIVQINGVNACVCCCRKGKGGAALATLAKCYAGIGLLHKATVALLHTSLDIGFKEKPMIVSAAQYILIDTNILRVPLLGLVATGEDELEADLRKPCLHIQHLEGG